MAVFEQRFRPEEIANLQRNRQLERERRRVDDYFRQLFAGGGGPGLNPGRDAILEQLARAKGPGELGEDFFGDIDPRKSNRFRGMSNNDIFRELQTGAQRMTGFAPNPRFDQLPKPRQNQRISKDTMNRLRAFPGFGGKGGPFGNPFGGGRRGVR